MTAEVHIQASLCTYLSNTPLPAYLQHYLSLVFVVFCNLISLRPHLTNDTLRILSPRIERICRGRRTASI